MTAPILISLRRALPVITGIFLFSLGVYALLHLIHSVDPTAVMAQIRGADRGAVVLAVTATALAYAALVGYDALALHFIGKPLPGRVVALGGFLGYAFGNTIGISILSGGAVRYRIYSAYGLNAFEVAAVSAYIAMALGTGLCLTGLAGLAVYPLLISEIVRFDPWIVQVASVSVLVAIVALILTLSISKRRLRLGRFELGLPGPRSLGAQLVITVLDVVAAAYTLWVLMPQGTPDLGPFVAIYAIAMMTGVLTHVPGGIGVFETVVIGALPPGVPVSEAAAALVLFRIIYYLLPFALGFILVALNEARLAGGWLGRLTARIPTPPRPVIEVLHGIAPSLAALTAFGFGAYLLLVSLVPSVRDNALTEGDAVAALLIEGGTLLSALVGVVLLVLSHGLVHRIRAAFVLTLGALVAGAGASLLNGLDLESAALLLAGALGLLPFAGGFPRQAKLTEGLFTPAWFALILGVGVAALGFFFFLHSATPYSNDLWTEIAHGANTPRALRAGLLASGVMLVVTLVTALRPVRQRPVSAQDGDVLARVDAILQAGAGGPGACLALSGDKKFLFSDSGAAFVMYAVQGARWVALGDPVGDPKEFPDLCWAFIDLARRANGQPVFYEVGASNLGLYVDLGLGLHKVGEEAVVDLQGFSLAGAAFKSMRAAHNKRQREGLEMTLTQPPHSPALLAELRAVSDAWLGSKTGREKGFSVGRFEPGYLDRFTIALVRREGRVLGDRKSVV